MKNEILRMERVTLIEDGVTLLNNLNLNMYKGEIMGLLSINANGQSALLDLICQNIPIHFGRIYFDEQLVNSHRRSSMSFNPVAMIEKESWLVDFLTVSDNVFVLSKNFKSSIVNPTALNKKLQELTEEIGVDIDGDTHINNLSDFECCVIEILKAAISGIKLIILQDISSFLNAKEISKLYEIMHHYTKIGLSFLYVCNQYDEISKLCDCAAIMENGKIRSILRKQDMEENKFDYPILVRRSLAAISNKESKCGLESCKESNEQPVLKMENVYTDNIKGMSFSVKSGECVVLFDTDDTFNGDIIENINGKPIKSGTLCVDNAPLPVSIEKHNTAIIPEKPIQNMLFPHLSYLDNICFTADNKVNGFWRLPRIRKSITNEFFSIVGENIYVKNINNLSIKELYCLAYHRIYFQRPKVAICIKPFSTIDYSLRLYVAELMQKLLDRGIALMILEKNISELLPLADRMILVKGGKIHTEFNRDQLQLLSDKDIQ